MLVSLLCSNNFGYKLFLEFGREFYFVFMIGLAFIIFEIYSKLETRKTDVWMHFIDKKNDLKHCGTTLQNLLSKSNYVLTVMRHLTELSRLGE